jgi:hypothetical protein
MTTSGQARQPQSPAAQGGQDARSDKLPPADGKPGGVADALAVSLRGKNTGAKSEPRK